MKRYVVELEAQERETLTSLTRKGSHRSQKVINALILLNCDAGAFNERHTTGEAIAEVLRISARRVDRVKKRFVEDGLEAALAVSAGATCEVPAQGGRGVRGRGWSRSVAGTRPKGMRSGRCVYWPTARLELGYIDSVSHETVRRVLKKTPSNRG